MAEPKRIRVRKPANLNVNLDVVKLQALIGSNKDLNVQTEISDGSAYLKTSYIRRIKSATKAFQLVCDSIKNAKYNEHVTDLQSYYLAGLNKVPPEQYQDLLLDYLQHLEYILSTIPKIHTSGKLPRQWLAKADEYLVLNERPILATVSQQTYGDDANNSRTVQIVQIEIPQQPISDATLQEYLDAYPASANKPQWYTVMFDYERVLFDASMQSIHQIQDQDQKRKALENKIQSISSRHRTLPGVANFSKHVFCILDENGKVLKKRESLRSSMVSSRDLQTYAISSNEKEALRDKFTVENITQLIQVFIQDKINADPQFSLSAVDLAKLPILLQTLISPMPGVPGLPDWDLYQDKQKAISQILKNGITIKNLVVNGQLQPDISFIPTVIETNHPLNSARHVMRTGSLLETSNTEANILKLCHLVGDDADPELISIKKQLLDLVKAVPDTLDSFSDNQRELHLAALEEMLVQRLGGMPYSSCVSGKDRKALELIYTDAMEIYLFRYKTLPEFNDSGDNRKNFTEIFADLYLSRHHQENAGQNSPGADGIKTPDKYLPKDIQETIIAKSNNKEILQESDRLASNNEFDKLLEEVTDYSKTNPLKVIGIGVAATVVVAGAITLLAIASIISFGALAAILIPVVALSAAATATASTLTHEKEETSQRKHWEKIGKLACAHRKKASANQQVAGLMGTLEVSEVKVPEEKSVVPESEQPKIPRQPIVNPSPGVREKLHR